MKTLTIDERRTLKFDPDVKTSFFFGSNLQLSFSENITNDDLHVIANTFSACGDFGIHITGPNEGWAALLFFGFATGDSYEVSKAAVEAELGTQVENPTWELVKKYLWE